MKLISLIAALSLMSSSCLQSNQEVALTPVAQTVTWHHWEGSKRWPFRLDFQAYEDAQHRLVPDGEVRFLNLKGEVGASCHFVKGRPTDGTLLYPNASNEFSLKAILFKNGRKTMPEARFRNRPELLNRIPLSQAVPPSLELSQMSWYAPSLNCQLTDLALSMDGMSTPCKKLHRLSQAGLYANPDFAAQINVLDQAAAQFLILTPHPDDAPPEQLDSFRRHRLSLIQAIATVKSPVDQNNFSAAAQTWPQVQKNCTACHQELNVSGYANADHFWRL